jgi:hypothetical protein
LSLWLSSNGICRHCPATGKRQIVTKIRAAGAQIFYKSLVKYTINTGTIIEWIEPLNALKLLILNPISDRISQVKHGYNNNDDARNSTITHTNP